MTDANTILLGFSGGVDSSLAAVLLRQAGHEVLALTLKMDSRNPAAEDEKATRAAAVAKQLGIRHQIEDARQAFQEEVLAPAWEEYQRGRTPNPCARCNPGFKFANLAHAADRLGIRKLATGHYARIDQTPSGPRLLRGLDRKKDQSYFLFNLPEAILSRTVFPLGGLNKDQVRAKARDFGLANAEQAESQDVCIALAGERFPELLREIFSGTPRPGPIVDTTGKILGQHPGLHRYTIGQRRGLGLALGTPAWICAIEADQARLVVSQNPKDLLVPQLETEATRWASGLDLVPKQAARVQIRSQHDSAPAELNKRDGGRCQVLFDQAQRAVAPGQAAVFYNESDSQVLGGGWIL